jgi:hypothetical protein
MRPNLLKVTAEKEYNLILEYENNEKRVYDFSAYLQTPYYEQLKHFALFKRIKLFSDRIEWMTGQDFPPDELYNGSIPLK